ncbi:neprilysin-like [Dermacentor albipictus]|uniref:neprilysin-like n=1 Tax=Dermacentor albipictus TaxID=60249 RepID=UPI0038FCEF5A
MTSNSLPPQTTAPGEVGPPLTHPPGRPEAVAVGEAPAEELAQPLAGERPATTLAMPRENEAATKTSRLTRGRRPRRRRGHASSVSSTSSSSGRSREPRRVSAAAACNDMSTRDNPQDLPLLPPSDTTARRYSAPDGLASQPHAERTPVRRVSIQLKPVAPVSTQSSRKQSQQPSDAPAPKRASIIKSTATRSSSANPVVAGNLARSSGLAPSYFGSKDSLPRRSSKARRLSLDRWFASKMEDPAQAFTTSRERAFSGIWRSTSDRAASRAATVEQQTLKGLQRWSSYRHPPTSSDENAGPLPYREQPSDVGRILRIPSLVALFILAAVVVIILLLPQSRQTNGDKKAVCSTADCIYHAHVLGLNRSGRATPCEDFGRFVCSGWDNKYRDIAFTVQMDAIMDWIARLTQSSRRANWTASVSGRPLNMMRECLRSINSKDDVRELVSFVSGRIFSWPTRDWRETGPLEPWYPLRTLLELAVLWGLPLWFRVDLVPSHLEHRKSLVVISPSPFPTAFHYLHSRFLRYADVYPLYVQDFIDIILSHRPAAPAFEAFIRASAEMQGHVFGNMTAAAEVVHFTPRVLTVETLQSLVKNVSAEDWIIAFRSVGTTPLHNDSLILAASESILTAMDTLFGVYTARDIWFHTVWWFAQAIGIVAVKTLFSDLKVHPLGKALQSIVCALHVDGSYSALLAANFKSHLSTTEQQTIRQLFDNIHAVAVQKVRSSTLLTSSTKSALATMLENTESVVWPQHDFDSKGALESFYGSAYAKADSFLGEWLWSRKQMQRARVSAVHTEASSVHRLSLRYLGWYDVALRILSISPAALAPPFYYSAGTSAMLYGGIGYIFAAQTLSALNTMFYLMKGDEILLPTDVTSRRALWSTYSCSSDNNTYLLFPDLPAVDVAYSAYLQYRDQSSDLPLQGFKIYSAEQLFFINYCHAGCYIDNKGGHVNPLCTAVLGKFAPFATAFSCPPGSAMNSGDRCSYF